MEFLVNFVMSTPPQTNGNPPCRTAKPPYWKLSGDGSEYKSCQT